LIWGQKTLQRRPTALDRVNVRRMMFYIEKQLRAKCRVLLFDPHDAQFVATFIQITQQVLAVVKLGRGLTDYMIQADSELNTPDVIDRNEFRARIGVQPTKAVEFIFLEFSIHRTGDFTSTN
jgi:phage tail sheath protein FI